MRVIWIETLLRKVYESWILLLSGLFLILSLCCVYVIPRVYVIGFSASLEELNSSEYSYRMAVFIALCFGWICLIAAKLVNSYMLFPLHRHELRQVLEDLISINLPIQFLVILLGEPRLCPDDVLMYLFSFTLYALLRSGCSITDIRINSNNFVNLKLLNLIVLCGTVVYTSIVTFLFAFKGLLVMLSLHFESIFIIKASICSSYILFFHGEMSNETTLRLGILENLLKLCQWVFLIAVFFEVSIINPLYVFVFMKVHHHIIRLLTLLKRFDSYKQSMKLFYKNYPLLSKHELEVYKDECCCICFDSLDSDKCSKLGCSHVFHVKCLHKWMTYNRERKCPICTQVYLSPQDSQERNFLGLLESVRDIMITSLESRVRQLQEMFPHISEDQIRGELARNGNIDSAINNLLLET